MDKLDEVREWAKEREEISISLIQRNFAVSFPAAKRILEALVEEGLFKEETIVTHTGRYVKNS